MEWTEIYRGPDDESLILLKGWLESQGVECVVRSDLVHSVHPISVDGLGEVRVLVDPKDSDRARALVDAFARRAEGGDAPGGN